MDLLRTVSTSISTLRRQILVRLQHAEMMDAVSKCIAVTGNRSACGSTRNVDRGPNAEIRLLTRRHANFTPMFVHFANSACHWCHVMAHESFEDPETARLMNEHFVNIKVDREERPTWTRSTKVSCS